MGKAVASPSSLMYAAHVAFLTILLLPHLPFNAERLLEPAAFKEQ